MNVIALLLLGAIVALPTPSPERSSETGRELVITGEVVETGCFVMAGRRGQSHRQCAIACARAGQPLGILEDRTGTLHLVVIDRREGEVENPLAPLIAERVEVRGVVVERGGISGIVPKRVRPLTPHDAR